MIGIFKFLYLGEAIKQLSAESGEWIVGVTPTGDLRYRTGDY